MISEKTEYPAAAVGGADAFTALEDSVYAVLETYSNVHRGSGHTSMATTALYERAREIVLETLGLDARQSVVIFCTPRRAAALQVQLGKSPESSRCLSSQDLGLPLGVRALVVDRGILPGGAPSQAGGGTARLVSPGWVIWAKAPDRFEAGTPAIVNVIAFARALQLARQLGRDAFQGAAFEKRTAAEILYRDELEGVSGQRLLDALRSTRIGRGIQVPTLGGARPYTNLDNGASTPTFAPVWEAVRQVWRQPVEVQREVVREVRSICAEVMGAPLADYDVIFTANTTEAINLAAESLRREVEPGVEPVVLNTLLEHNSNELPWRQLPGWSLVRLSVDAEGFVDLGELEKTLAAYNRDGAHGKQRIRLVAVSGASNVLGSFNDLAEIGRIAHRHGARLLVDAAQLVAHRKVEMEKWGIDYLAFSAHKAYAPFGTGVLVARKGMLRFSPAEMEQIHASGEENAGGIAALGKALVLLQRIGLDVIQAEEQALTARTLRGLVQIPGVTVYGVRDPGAPRFGQKGGVIAFGVKGLLAGRVAQKLAEQGGIGVRSGCHCAHMLVKRLVGVSPALELFQGAILTAFQQVSLPGITRVSLGIENTVEDVDTLLGVVREIAHEAGDGKRSPAQTVVKQEMEGFVRERVEWVYAADLALRPAER